MNRLILPYCACLILAGCQPSSDSQPEKSIRSADEIHQTALVLDAHADIEIPGAETRYAGADGRSQVAPDKMRAGGMDAVVMAIAVGPGPRTEAGYAEATARAEAELKAIQEIVADPSNSLVLAKTPDELMKAHESNQGALILGFQNARILANDVAKIDDYFAAGVRVFALTHMGHNNFADSSRPVFLGEVGHHEPDAEHGGLSDLGRQAINRINELGAIVDVSQLSKLATLEVVARSSSPVIASHSNVAALTQVRRNLSDEEIDEIARKGGVIHIAAFKGYLFDSSDKDMDTKIRAARKVAGIIEDYDYPFELYWEIDDPKVQATYLSTVSDIIGPGSIDAMLDHLDYVVDRVGVDHVGIGNDFNHGSGIAGFADASEALNITRALVDRGYSSQDINKIWGGNFVRVWRATQVVAQK
ncbi:MAG: membrane dipeptidase [Pseudomonadota bacterium]